MTRNWETAGIWQLHRLAIAMSEEADLTDGSPRSLCSEIFTRLSLLCQDTCRLLW